MDTVSERGLKDMAKKVSRVGKKSVKKSQLKKKPIVKPNTKTNVSKKIVSKDTKNLEHTKPQSVWYKIIKWFGLV